MSENKQGARHYFLREESQMKNKKGENVTVKRIIGVVAISINAENPSLVDRGVSICSKGDVFDKKKGVELAMKRMEKAQAKRGSLPFRVYTGRQAKAKNPAPNIFSERCTYGGAPTDFERPMLDL